MSKIYSDKFPTPTTIVVVVAAAVGSLVGVVEVVEVVVCASNPMCWSLY